MKDLFSKMIDHPIATLVVVGALADGISVLVHNIGITIKKSK